MVRKFQARENYDDYDPNPYKGGYDINEAYGDVQAADEDCAYPRTEYGEDDEPQDVQYGNESNPYRRGPPGPSIYGGRPQPGAVYGGGRDRTRPSYDEAQPDDGVQTRYSRRQPAYGGDEQSGYGLDEDDSGYRKPRPGYGYGDEEQSSRYRNPSPAYGQQDSSGYGNPTYGYGTEESGYRKPRPAYDDEETGQSGYRNPSYGYGEQETGGGYGYGRTSYSRDEESSQVRSGYGQTTYGEQEGYGDYGGGSAYTEQPPQQEPPARRSWW